MIDALDEVDKFIQVEMDKLKVHEEGLFIYESIVSILTANHNRRSNDNCCSM